MDKFTTTISYNALGKTTQKISPETDVTLNNGFIDRQSPTTDYYYDLRGNVIGVKDARGNMTTQIWENNKAGIKSYNNDKLRRIKIK